MLPSVKRFPHEPLSPSRRSIHGPATDALPVTPDDASDLPMAAIARYIETGGTVDRILLVQGVSGAAVLEVLRLSPVLPLL